MFCTSTIIEGVNTSAKNVVFFDKKKGGKPIDFFDYSNIKGRSGRFMVHYVGRIFNFNRPPEKENIIVDIPFFEQNPINDEVLIHLDRDKVKNKESDQYKELLKIPYEERELIKKNGVLVKGQKNILEILKKSIHDESNYKLIYWNGFPQYEQLEYILSFGWENLIKKGETTHPMTLRKLIKVTSDYGRGQNISNLIDSNYRYFKDLPKYKNKSDEEVFDEAVRDAFQILRHWFQYKVPKWLNVINELQKYVCEKITLIRGIIHFTQVKLKTTL